MNKVNTLRRMLNLLNGEERLIALTEKLGKTGSNQEFLDSLSKGV